MDLLYIRTEWVCYRYRETVVKPWVQAISVYVIDLHRWWLWYRIRHRMRIL